ncbi:MAG: hypothetical protein H0T75_00435 [Rhizobiales bacterium]|nr:hypothetical protein [Hyphomicrobiales bacterium]
MQDKSGAQARALQLELQSLVEGVVSKKETEATKLFPQFARWHTDQLLNHWELVNLTTEVEDYGLSDWKGRKLETIEVKVFVRDRNRNLGENRETCFALGGIVDSEFAVYRAPVETPCDGGSEYIAKWKDGHRFESLWIAE